MYLEIQFVLKFGEERTKIALILFVFVILSSKWSFKKPIFDQKGGQNTKFQKIKKYYLQTFLMYMLMLCPNLVPFRKKMRSICAMMNDNKLRTSNTPYREPVGTYVDMYPLLPH